MGDEPAGAACAPHLPLPTVKAEDTLSMTPHKISLPMTPSDALAQDQSFFRLTEDGKEHRIRLHDYGQIYSRPGLYEQLFYQRLLCTSPMKAQEVLLQALRNNHIDVHTLRVLDLGAGNGMVGELLDAARVVGVDIFEEARMACERDRPHAYDAYYVADMTQPGEALMDELRQWRLNCMTCIAALGFGDIPVRAFANAFNLLEPGGWAAFNIKESFLSDGDQSGFSTLIKGLMMHDTMQVHHLERYRHRLSIDGQPLFYYLVAGCKQRDITEEEITAALASERTTG